MFYRRKIILALLELLGGGAEKLRLQKLLFLFSMRKQQPEYDFVPYKLGCYSFSATADMSAMVKKEILNESENLYIKKDSISFFDQLKHDDQKMLLAIVSDYGRLSHNALIRHTYINFPFYAINSTIAKDVLNGNLYDSVEDVKPKGESTVLFTIGYEGVSLERYLLKLIEKNVKLLIDVRRNPLSMKFGFSKTLLRRYCNSLGIDYLHMPEVGIASDQRQSLETQRDYDKLFAHYCETTILETVDAQFEIMTLLKSHNRVALTCFEADPRQCHRSHLANAISHLPDFDYPVKHL
jgi:hypothetical protein